MLIKQSGPFKAGYTTITEQHGAHSDMELDFKILNLVKGEFDSINECDNKNETAYLLMAGHVRFSWADRNEVATRASLMDDGPYVLHVPAAMPVSITLESPFAEIAVVAKENSKAFDAKFYTPSDIEDAEFGKGTMQETSTRIVRTIFDAASAPYSEMVLGEVINFPGKWSSYPPHDHPQPEIYHFRFMPENGFGFSQQGDDVYCVTHQDTVTIVPDVVHPQVAAPGYAMYYIWMIPHIENGRFGPDSRQFVDEHTWLMKEDAQIWPDKKDR